jgi:hypothetical protein
MGIIVNPIMKLGIGGVDSLVHAELVQVRPIRGLEPSAAVVLGIAAVIRDSFAVKIETRAFYSPGNFLRSASRAAVPIRSSLVAILVICSLGEDCCRSEESNSSRQPQTRSQHSTFHSIWLRHSDGGDCYDSTPFPDHRY